LSYTLRNEIHEIPFGIEFAEPFPYQVMRRRLLAALELFTSRMGGDSMKNLIAFGVMAIALAIGIPAMANAEEPMAFYALSRVADQDLTAMRPLSDEQLASVEGGHNFGGGYRNVYGLLARLLCGVGLGQNIAVVNQNNTLIQINIAIGNNNVQINNATQTNTASIFQSVRSRGHGHGRFH
jgi:hypothetical protein